MIVRFINILLDVLTRPYIAIEKYFITKFQSFLPEDFDENTGIIVFGLVVIFTIVVAYSLSRYVTIKDADDDPVYQRKKFYEMQRKYDKIN